MLKPNAPVNGDPGDRSSSRMCLTSPPSTVVFEDPVVERKSSTGSGDEQVIGARIVDDVVGAEAERIDGSNVRGSRGRQVLTWLSERSRGAKGNRHRARSRANDGAYPPDFMRACRGSGRGKQQGTRSAAALRRVDVLWEAPGFSLPPSPQSPRHLPPARRPRASNQPSKAHSLRLPTIDSLARGECQPYRTTMFNQPPAGVDHLEGRLALEGATILGRDRTKALHSSASAMTHRTMTLSRSLPLTWTGISRSFRPRPLRRPRASGRGVDRLPSSPRASAAGPTALRRCAAPPARASAAAAGWLRSMPDAGDLGAASAGARSTAP